MPKIPKGVTRRSDGRYAARFQLNGEKYCVYGKTVKEVTDKMDNLKYEVSHGLYCKPNNETVNSWFDTWMSEYKKNTLKPSTIDRYTRDYRLFIMPKIGKMKLGDVQPQAIQHIINDMYNNGYSQSQIKITYAVIKQMFDQAMKNRMIVHDPIDAVTLPRFKKSTQEDRRVMSLSEQNTFLEYARNSIYYSFYLFSLQTGMRIGEICGLEWSDIDFKDKEIHVNGTLVYIRGKKRFKGAPKTETSNRTIPMLPGVEKILRNIRKEQFENRIALGKDYKTDPDLPDDFVFTYPDGNSPYWDESIRKDIDKIVQKINDDGIEFEKITPHTFRHTFATRCVEQGMPLQVLKTILGHSSLAMTADLYSHVLPDTKQEEMMKISNLF